MKELELSEAEFNPQQRVDDFKNLDEICLSSEKVKSKGYDVFLQASKL